MKNLFVKHFLLKIYYKIYKIKSISFLRLPQNVFYVIIQIMQNLQNLNNIQGLEFGHIGLVLILVIVWSFVWKGIALWKAARNNSLPWYIALLIINTLGVLEILYIFIFSKVKNKNNKDATEK